MATNENFLPTCDPGLTPIAATRSSTFTPRRAIDSSGQVGSFYDAYNDRVLSDSNKYIVKEQVYPKKKSRCFLKSVDLNESCNLLKQMNMNDELRLSIALQMAKPSGVGALINYTDRIDKYTRFLCYTYYSKTDYLPDNVFNSLNRIKQQRPDAQATHMIVLVNWGIDAVAVLQLPSDDQQTEGNEYVLQKICISLSDDCSGLKLSNQEEAFLKNIYCRKVFSNIAGLTEINSIIEFHDHIKLLTSSADSLRPYDYNLYPIENFYITNSGLKFRLIEIPKQSILKIESYLLPLVFNFNKLNKNMYQDFQNIRQYLKNEHKNILTCREDSKKMYTIEIDRIRKLVTAFRRGEIDERAFRKDLQEDQTRSLSSMLSNDIENVNKMMKKESLIKSLLDEEFIYMNAKDRGIEKTDDIRTLEDKLLKGAGCARLICSNDNLYAINQTQWCEHRDQMLKERKGNKNIQLVYADFSYCSYELNQFITLSSAEKKKTVSTPEPKKKLTLQKPTCDESINILLLGESGVGKSTFINAFVNYLKFDDLMHAEKNPTVLIPVSFTIAIGDNFTEHAIKHEGEDTLSNEDHDDLGRSVTQHCKSYVFTLKDGKNRRQKLRIIDTPGIGDTQGSNQDDKNMQHVLSYINNLTHLNAICILLKPNNSRLTVFFRSCFTQLIDMLSENICDRIIFCFTNSRSTFYTPGNTGPVLKALIDSLPVKQIRFAKENTFCFDSESFRYLVAKLNRIKFNSMEEADYNSSWEKSMTELNRFIGYIRSNMADPIILNKSHSVKHAQLMANSMIRPMLEAMRNTIRNIILLNERSHKTSIELCPKIIKGTTAICLECPRKCIKICDFWVAIDGLHVVQNKCRTCLCDPSQHYRIDYELEYKEIENSAKPTEGDMQKLLHSLYEASPKFGYFLLQSVGNSQRDPFLLGFERMIKEESDICDQKTSYKFNLDLVEQLQVLKNSYEKEKKKLDAKKMTIELDDIYQKIENVNKHRIIDLQMNAIRQWHKYMIKYYEYEVST
ncbi:unnamed protein product [Rotaria magnacalcarata]|uniref:G domain-containing protein n=2 Tax=Rotaria magnacalcarata TaxID=392030 RepID=A0A819Y243_9BILA|nr:unnamed protein product [Rotaria magnacalcarata]CAF4151520.1 unnamed protein product [Rotaria magnacalcarata]